MIIPANRFQDVNSGLRIKFVGLDVAVKKRVIRGQVAIATTVGKVRRVRLIPVDPPATRQASPTVMSTQSSHGR